MLNVHIWYFEKKYIHLLLEKQNITFIIVFIFITGLTNLFQILKARKIHWDTSLYHYGYF